MKTIYVVLASSGGYEPEVWVFSAHSEEEDANNVVAQFNKLWQQFRDFEWGESSKEWAQKRPQYRELQKAHSEYGAGALWVQEIELQSKKKEGN